MNVVFVCNLLAFDPENDVLDFDSDCLCSSYMLSGSQNSPCFVDVSTSALNDYQFPDSC